VCGEEGCVPPRLLTPEHRIRRFDPQTLQRYDKRHSLFGQMDPKHQITYTQGNTNVFFRAGLGSTVSTGNYLSKIEQSS
jgi:hypothetical protein